MLHTTSVVIGVMNSAETVRMNYAAIMAIAQYPREEPDSLRIVVWHEFGTSAGTSPYYEINAQESYPIFYYTEEGQEGWRLALGDEHPEYVFEKGKKYTYSCGDNGPELVFTIYVDGTSKAPAEKQIVAQQRILKSDLMDANKIQVR